MIDPAPPMVQSAERGWSLYDNGQPLARVDGVGAPGRRGVVALLSASDSPDAKLEVAAYVLTANEALALANSLIVAATGSLDV